MYFGSLDTVSNRADWQEAVVLTDEETGDLIDISLCRITLTVRTLRQRPNPNSVTPLGGYSGFGYDPPGCVVLTGSTDTGEVTLPDVGTFMWTFTALQMASLYGGAYEIGVRISQDTRTVQLIVGQVNVIDGIDTQ